MVLAVIACSQTYFYPINCCYIDDFPNKKPKWALSGPYFGIFKFNMLFSYVE